MSDDEHRALERRWRESGDPADERAYYQALRRAGETPAIVLRLRVNLVMDPLPEGERQRVAASLADLRSRCENWAVDLSRTRYVNTRLLGLLLVVQRDLLQAGGKLVLCGASAPVLQVVEMLGLFEAIALAASVEDCLAHEAWTAGAEVDLSLTFSD